MRHSINKIIPLRQEQLAGFDLVALTFAEAYAELRRACPEGDLRIHLTIDVPEEGGALDPHDMAEQERAFGKLSRHERHQLAADNGVDTWEEYRGER